MLSQFASVVLRINDSTQESYQQLADQKKNMLSRLASMKEEIILDVSTDISKLNDSVQELADQMGYRVEQVQTAIVNSQMLLHAPSNCCQIDNEIMKQEIASEVTQKIKHSCPLWCSVYYPAILDSMNATLPSPVERSKTASLIAPQAITTSN